MKVPLTAYCGIDFCAGVATRLNTLYLIVKAINIIDKIALSSTKKG